MTSSTNRTIHETLECFTACDPVCVRETLAKAAELGGLDADGAAVLMARRIARALGRAFRRGQPGQGRDLRLPVALFAPLHVLTTATTSVSIAPSGPATRRSAAGRSPANRRRGRESLSIRATSGFCWSPARAAGSLPTCQNSGSLALCPTRRPRAWTTSSARSNGLCGPPRPGRNPPRQRQPGAPGSRRIPPAESGPDRHLPTFQETYHRDTYAGSTPGAGTLRRSRRHRYGPRHGSRHRRRGHRCPVRARRLAVRTAGAVAARPLARTRFGVGPHTISVPRIEPATGTPPLPPPAPSGERRGLLQAGGDHPADGALYRA